MEAKIVVVGLGLALLVIGGIVFFVFDAMAGDMSWEERSANPGKWVTFQTYSGLGFVLGVIGAFILSVYFALYVRPKQKWGGEQKWGGD